ncbi:MAG: ATP-binding protein [Acidobacteriota bacterium]
MSLRRYENQIRIFFILLVFTLLIINIMNFYLLSSSRNILINSVIEKGKAISASAFRSLVESGATQILTSPGKLESPVYSSYLRRWVSKSGLLSGSILNSDGEIIVSSENFMPMEDDPDFLKLGEVPAKSLRLGMEVHLAPEAGRVVYLSPVLSPERKILGFLKSAYYDADLQSQEKHYRVLIISQAAVIIILLVLGILFGSWVAKPFRALEEAASRIPETIKKEWGWADEPILVEESFKKVLEKIMEQEETLHRLHGSVETLDVSVEAFVEKVGREMVSGVIYLGSDGRIITMNPEAEKILDDSLERLKGKLLLSATAHIDGLSDLIEQSIGEGKKFSREVLKSMSRDWKRGHIGAAVTPVKGEAGKIIGALCILTDLTEIQNLQERGRVRENLAAAGVVSAGIAHEFRNSLGAILANAKLIIKGRSIEESVESAKAILKEVESSKRIVDDFLSYAKPAKLNLSRVDLKKLLMDLKDDLKNNEQFKPLQIELHADPLEISADEALLKQAFLNIIRNSAEAYGPSGGRVEIALERSEDKKGKVIFYDYAGGVPDDQIDRIFIPFFSTKESGTGLGLAIAQKIIVSHDGIIEVENRKGIGLIFKITFPFLELRAS